MNSCGVISTAECCGAIFDRVPVVSSPVAPTFHDRSFCHALNSTP